MTDLRLCAALGACLVLSACQSPNGVGLGLIDDVGDDPQALVVAATAADTVETEFVTSGFAQSSATPFQPRVLIGTVQDPLYGDARAVGYLDASRVSPVPVDFADSTIVGIELRLERGYVYGDTEADVPLELRAIDGAWSPTGLPNDTTLATSEVLATAVSAASDTTVVFELPASFVAANDTTFRSTAFGSSFEGFAVSVPDGTGGMPGAVHGFDTRSSRVLVRTSGGDSLVYPLSEIFSSLTRGEAAPAPEGRLLLQGSAPVGLALQFDLAALENVPLARARLKLPLDRTLAGSEGTFERPVASTADLFGRNEDDERVFLATLQIDPDEGDAVTAPQSGDLTSALQRVLLGQLTFERYEVLVRPSPLSLDVLPLIVQPADGEPAPRLLLTVVGGPA